MFDRRRVLRLLAGTAAGVGLVPILAGPMIHGQTAAAATLPAMGEMALGAAEAPVTIIEYFSLTCSHCASFHNQVFPKLKEAYIDTGKARFLSRAFPRDMDDLHAQMLARCAGEERYFAFIDMLFDSFRTWTRARDSTAALARLGRLGGIDQKTFDTCIADTKLEDAVLALGVGGRRDYDVRATPTFIINGKKFEGSMKFERFEEILTPLLP